MNFEEFGLLGLFITSFLAATFLPFSSEAVFLYLQKEGGSIVHIVIFASIGNTLGSILNYYLGSLGKLDWAKKYLGISQKNLDRVKNMATKYGPLSSILCWLPILGDPLALCLGIFKTNPFLTFTFMFIGKTLRYIVLALLMY
ncbi:MAG: membrane protein YqaA with SNARE-associated domain [Bacteriovoracaceae bacterium]